MATKKYLTYDGLTEYDGLIKNVISDGDASVKSYADTELAKKADKVHSHEGFVSYIENQNLTEDQKVIGRENINAKPKDLIATITSKAENGSVVYTCDTSSADLWAAHEAGRNVIFNIGGLIFINAEFGITASQSDSEIKQVRAMLFTNAKTGHLYVVNEDDTVTFTNSNFVTTANVKQETGIDRKMPMSQKAVTEALATKSDIEHTHDDLYYTETEVDTKLSEINTSITNITNGSTPVKEAEHADSADSATYATSASDAEKLGGQLPSYYAKASDIPTGALADKDVVSESDLDSELAAKVNAAAEGNHSHSNKTVLDGITSEKVSAWDSAEANAKAYADTAASDAATAVKNDLLNGAGAAYDTLKELGDLIDVNVDAIDALNDVAAGKADKSDLEALETSIGEQISEAISEIPQPDWNQNDETASDYIKNKPFGEKIGFDTYIEEQIVEFAASGSGARAELDYLKYIEWDAICNVYFDGVLYENIAAYESSGDMSVYVDFTTENGDRISICESSVIYAPASYVGQTHTIKAGVVSNIITPIENKYLGISVAPGTGTNSVRLNDLDSTVASGEYSHAEGFRTIASGNSSHAEGSYTTASGLNSHAEGSSTIASGTDSHAEGYSTVASGDSSHAEGYDTTASGKYSHAEGYYTIARGNSQHVSGSYNIAETPHITKETVLTSTDYICKSNDKVNIHICDGYTFDAETGLFTLTPINWDSVVNPTSYSPMGYSDVYMIYGNESGKTMYYNADLVAYNSGAEVRANVGTTKYESIDVSLNKGKYIEIVGNGTSNSARSNAHTLDWDGNAWFAGDVTVGADAKKLATEESVTALSERIGDTPVSEQISGAIDGLATEEYVNTAKADKEHSHEIADVTNLQTTLDEISEKANESDVLVVKFGGNETNGFTADKTFEQIKEAYDNNKHVFARHASGGIRLDLTRVTASRASFSGATLSGLMDYNLTITSENVVNFTSSSKSATQSLYGGVKAAAKSDTDTVEAKIGTDGKLYVPTYPSLDGYYTEAEIDSKLAGKADATHSHEISEITNLQTTLNNAASGIQTNTDSINAHTDRISALEASVGEFSAITTAEIQALFA